MNEKRLTESNVVLDVDNTAELLKPGMTAQVRLVVGNRQNVLRIPTATLRYKLSDEEIAKEEKAKKDAPKKDTANANASTPLPAPEAEDDVAFRSKNETTRSFKIDKLDVIIGVDDVIVACGFASFVGIFSGFYPARRASSMLPVDCLRYE